jgi:hypothetical protein
MAGYCSTGQSPQRAVVLIEEEEEEDEEEDEEEEEEEERFSENRAVNEIMAKNMVESETLQMTILQAVASWIIKDTRAQAHTLTGAPTHTHTHTETCNTYCFAISALVHERAWMLRHTYIA